MGIKQDHKCVDSFMQKPAADVPLDKTFAYSSDTVGSYGTDFDVFFSKKGDSCSVDSCELKNDDCSTTLDDNRIYINMATDKLEVTLSTLRGFTKDMCIICTGAEEISQTFKVSQTDRCFDKLVVSDKFDYSTADTLKWYDKTGGVVEEPADTCPINTDSTACGLESGCLWDGANCAKDSCSAQTTD